MAEVGMAGVRRRFVLEQSKGCIAEGGLIAAYQRREGLSVAERQGRRQVVGERHRGRCGGGSIVQEYGGGCSTSFTLLGEQGRGKVPRS